MAYYSPRNPELTVCNSYKQSSFGLFPAIPGYSQVRSFVSQYIGIMNTPANNRFDLVLDEFAYIYLIRFTDGDQRGVDLWIQLRPNVLALKRHGLSETVWVKKNHAVSRG